MLGARAATSSIAERNVMPPVGRSGQRTARADAVAVITDRAIAGGAWRRSGLPRSRAADPGCRWLLLGHAATWNPPRDLACNAQTCRLRRSKSAALGDPWTGVCCLSCRLDAGISDIQDAEEVPGSNRGSALPLGRTPGLTVNPERHRDGLTHEYSISRAGEFHQPHPAVGNPAR